MVLFYRKKIQEMQCTEYGTHISKKIKERQNMKNNSTLVQNKVLGGGVTINN